MASNRNEPAERLKTHNWAAWCRAAGACKYFCRLCGWPLDNPIVSSTSFPPPNCCLVCSEMEAVLNRRTYWVDLNRTEAIHRKNMGLD